MDTTGSSENMSSCPTWILMTQFTLNSTRNQRNNEVIAQYCLKTCRYKYLIYKNFSIMKDNKANRWKSGFRSCTTQKMRELHQSDLLHSDDGLCSQFAAAITHLIMLLWIRNVIQFTPTQGMMSHKTSFALFVEPCCDYLHYRQASEFVDKFPSPFYVFMKKISSYLHFILDLIIPHSDSFRFNIVHFGDHLMVRAKRKNTKKLCKKYHNVSVFKLTQIKIMGVLCEY